MLDKAINAPLRFELTAQRCARTLLPVLLCFGVVVNQSSAKDIETTEQTAAGSGSSVERLIGVVYDAETGKQVYTEQHLTVREETKARLETRYVDVQDSLIGQRLVEYRDGKVVRYELEQPHIGRKEIVERTEDGLLIEKIEKDERRAKQVTYKNPESIVIDAGFDDLIVRRWDELIEGQSLRVPFASTGQLDVVYLQLKRVDASNTVLEKAGKVRFEMNAANPILRFLLDPVIIEYYTESKELASYRGISNLKDENDQAYQVFIEFQHDRPVDNLAFQ